jgi:hypothetical protein
MIHTIFEKYAAARAKYPEDIKSIEAEEERVKKLLQSKEYSANPVTLELLEVCRRDVIECRRKLATDRTLINEPDVQADLWAIIDARMWFIGLVARDFEGELQMIETGLDAELQK